MGITGGADSAGFADSAEFALDRVVVVQGTGEDAGQGSGVLLDAYVVLTAAHVVAGEDIAEVIHPAYGRPVPCKVAWTSAELDVALLAADLVVIGGERAAPLGAIRYGRIATASPVPHCQIVGFPDIQRYGPRDPHSSHGTPGDELEYDQYEVSVLPMAGRVRDLLVCQLGQSAADEHGPAGSPLAGLSGAPVFAGAVLLGVVTQVPRYRHHLRIEAVPVETAMRAAQREFGWSAGTFEDVTEVHPQDERFEARYADDLKAQYRRTEIFGIEELGRGESRWDLDTAYHSLEAVGTAPERATGTTPPGATTPPGTAPHGATPPWTARGAAPGTVPGSVPGTTVPETAPEPAPGAAPGMAPGRTPGTTPATPPGMAPGTTPGMALGTGPETAPDPSRRRIETLLTDRPRALLRGEAGAGKTTLVWWLAAHAATGTLDRRLRELNHLVPFVVPLRKVHARGSGFPSLEELPSTGRVLSEEPPPGWVRRVLAAGRGLLLVDGLDEVPEREREEARRWLSVLLDRYPRTRCLATVRPNAVPRHWLAADGFTELNLLPMNDDDIDAFVRAWHTAARLECGRHGTPGTADEERARLSTLEESLLHQLQENDALHTLARTPLLCAVICALHRRRGGLLPTTRWSLYRAALAMLLGGRDAGRGVVQVDLTLDPDEQHALLQRIAIWLVRTGRQQMTRAEAGHQLGLALRDMPRIRSQNVTADRVLQFLLDRSGLLQERGDDDIQFIHRTFQDFLAAKEFQESGYVLELLAHARDEEWRDVVVMGAGHATRQDAQRLIEQLIEQGDAAGQRPERFHLHLLAARCAVGLLSLDEGLRGRIRGRVGALLPPESSAEIRAVSELGDWVVDLLPGPERLADEAAQNVVQALTGIRSTSARGALRAYVSHPNSMVRMQIVWGWMRQPLREYAREVLTGMHAPALTVRTPEQLATVACLASVELLWLPGDFTSGELAARLPASGTRHLHLRGNTRVEDLDFLRGRTDLETLMVENCPALRDFSALAGLGLEVLELGGETVPECWDAVSASASLTGLYLVGGHLRDLLPDRAVPNIGWLGLTDIKSDIDLETIIQVFTGVRSIDVRWTTDQDARPLVIDLTPLHSRPTVTIEFWADDLERIGFLGEKDMGDRLLIRRSPSTAPERA
ncbi:NACHT domain-containing protein [Streptomyces sp. NPDC093252]|uniref:NACHT domain-containing protein n=1 Tax=Streptomyces sp. NPDC093252 TaxID=3154980 RepID=UPI0034427279